MPILIVCPSCQTHMNAPSTGAGKRVQCPKCGQVLLVPVPAAASILPPIEPRQETPPGLPPGLVLAAGGWPPGSRLDSSPDLSGKAAASNKTLWIVLAAGAALFLCFGGLGLGALAWAFLLPSDRSVPSTSAASPSKQTSAGRPTPREQPNKPVSEPTEPVELDTIYQISPRRIVAKLVKKGSPIPPGWQSGGGVMSFEQSNAMLQLSAVLAGGKEGDTATYGR
jgi:hypothetical protein